MLLPLPIRYPTICGLAGVDTTDERAAAAGLWPVEGVDLWPLLSGSNSTPPRTEVVLGMPTMSGANSIGDPFIGVQALIDAQGYKLVIGTTHQVSYVLVVGELTLQMRYSTLVLCAFRESTIQCVCRSENIQHSFACHILFHADRRMSGLRRCIPIGQRVGLIPLTIALLGASTMCFLTPRR